ncbi:signal recognition particle protein, partial [Halobacteriovorax sp. HFRX-1_3]
IINSMTKKERDNYKIMKDSHIKRIAKGSGNTEAQVRDFIAKFKQMEQMMGGLSQMMKGGGMPGMPGMPGMGGGGMPNLPGLGGKKKKPRKKGGPWGGGFF